jgi:hypothetical protein
MQQLHVFLARGDTCKQRATLKPPVVGSQPAGPQANKLGPDTAKLSTQRHLYGRPQKLYPNLVQAKVNHLISAFPCRMNPTTRALPAHTSNYTRLSRGRMTLLQALLSQK